MPDVQLDTIELRLARTSSGVRGFAFLHALDEPGEPGRVGTIIFDKLHHGVGAETAVEADRYRVRTGTTPPLMHLPGEIRQAGEDALISSGSTTAPVSEGHRFASSFQRLGDSIFVLPSRILRVPGGTGTVVTVHQPAGAFSMAGPPAFYHGEWFFGREVTSGANHLASATAVSWDGTAIDTALTIEASFFVVAHGALYALDMVVVPNTNTVTWDLRRVVGTANEAKLIDNYEDILVNQHAPFPTGLAVVGGSVVVFGSLGEVMAVAPLPPGRTSSPVGLLSIEDPEFGHVAKLWEGDVVTPSRDGLFIVPGGVGTDISPVRIQGPVGSNDLLRPACITPMGSDLLVGTRGGGIDPIPSVLLLRRYPEGPSYNWIREITDTASPIGFTDYNVQAMEYLSTGVLSILSGNAFEGRLSFIRLPNALGGQHSIAPSTDAVVQTANVYGPFSGRKLALQVRGHYREASATSSSIDVIADGGSPVAAGTVTAAGVFTMTGARVIGSTFALRVTLSNDVAVWPRFLLPLMLDYIEEPRAGDRIQLIVEVPTGMRRRDAGATSVEAILLSLRALRNAATTVTLTLHDVAGVPSTFTVLVEKVDSNESTLAAHPYREYSEAVAVIELRVV